MYVIVYVFSIFSRSQTQHGLQNHNAVPAPDHTYSSRFSVQGLAYNANNGTVRGVPTGGAEGGAQQGKHLSTTSENPYAIPNDVAFSKLQSKEDEAGYTNPAFLGENPPAYSSRPVSTASDANVSPQANA